MTKLKPGVLAGLTAGKTKTTPTSKVSLAGLTPPVRAHRGVDIKSSRLDAVNEWARETLTEENQMIYLRLKDGIITWIKANDMMADKKWTPLRESDLNAAISLASGDARVKPEVEPEPIPLIAIGWYQDSLGNLHKHLGSGEWDSPASTWKQLTKLADAGTLEYIS